MYINCLMEVKYTHTLHFQGYFPISFWFLMNLTMYTLNLKVIVVGPGWVAQLIERGPMHQRVASSIPH